MSKLEYFSIEVKPWAYAGYHGGEEKLYRFVVRMNGKEYHIEKGGGIPPYMTEIEWLVRQSHHLRDELEKLDTPNKEEKA